MKARLLVVEDEAEVRTLMCTYLKRRGFDVTAASTAKDFNRRFAAKGYDLVLLDLNLAEADGIGLLRQVRARSRAPVFVVSGRLDERSRLQALELGADDFVRKPFSLRELELRIGNFLKRQAERAPEAPPARREWRFGDWTLDTARRTLISDDGETPELTRGEFDVLACLVEAEGQVVERATIVEYLEQRGFAMSPDSLTTVVYRLRRKLGASDGGAALIGTQYGVGFRLLVDVIPQ